MNGSKRTVPSLSHPGVMRLGTVIVRGARPLAGATNRSALRARRSACVLNLRQTDERQQANVEPADVELVPLRLELRGVWIGVVVVMQLLATEPDRDGRDVSALVLDLEVSIAER